MCFFSKLPDKTIYMVRQIVVFTFLVAIANFSQAQLKSPEEFLGYKIGSRYTPHSRIVEYYRHAAANSPSVMKLQQYGETNEGRPLLVAFISSSAIIQNLDAIRINNLRLAGIERNAPSGDQPAIVWLSYNVHGNEASSSEASLVTLYELISGNNTQARQWLQNTLVIIDPCLNPDGRDRYVNWFTSVVGKNTNPALDAREHREVWPGGRTNHYYFDLNRDWAWQVQVETRQRMKIYNDWLPHVHVDFHEQYIDNPYYFAPAAQPYHEVISPWQREFQTTIGRNHAKYFDEKGWLYFTKEYFDLLYPSYGDTYPIYNGSIGMTYEQAGHSLSGTSVVTDIGDTLTLNDRVLHHFTTGLSTIEISSKNASRLATEFHDYFSGSAKNGVGEHKAFIIRNNPQDAVRIHSLLDLLDKNDIQYGNGKAASLKAYNYNNGKEETISLSAGDIVVSTMQPKGALVKVLFEPNTTVVDSNTYDITAWSLPYAYGLNAYASRQTVDVSRIISKPMVVNNPVASPYGYIIRWNGTPGVKLVAKLLEEGIRLRFAEEPFESGGQSFGRGSVIVIKTSNQHIPDLWERVRRHADANNIQLTAVATGFVDKGVDFGSSKIRALKKRNIALLTGEGTSANASGEVWHFFDRVIEQPITLINLNDFSNLNLGKYDVIIMSNGNYRFLNDKTQAEKLKNWVSEGGRLIALENAVTQLARTDWAIKSKKQDDNKDTSTYAPLRRYEDRERDFIPNQTPGSIFKVELDNTHPLAFGYPNYYYTLKLDDNIYEFIKEGGWNVGVIKRNNQLAGFVGSKLKSKLQDGLLLGSQSLGRGTIIYFADNPLFRGFWENGKLLFCNAVFLVGQ